MPTTASTTLNRDDLLVLVLQPGAAEIDVLHDPHLLADAQGVADFKGAGDDEHDAGAVIGDRSLHGQTETEGAGPDESDEGGDLNARLAQSHDAGEGDDDQAAEPGKEPGERDVDFSFITNAEDRSGDNFRQPEADDDDPDGNGDADSVFHEVEHQFIFHRVDLLQFFGHASVGCGKGAWDHGRRCERGLKPRQAGRLVIFHGTADEVVSPDSWGRRRNGVIRDLFPGFGACIHHRFALRILA